MRFSEFVKTKYLGQGCKSIKINTKEFIKFNPFDAQSCVSIEILFPENSRLKEKEVYGEPRGV